jgi:GTP cyclohydrolase I
MATSLNETAINEESPGEEGLGSTALPDHAADTDHRDQAIDQVGVRDLRWPMSVWDREHQRQHTVGRLSLSVGLPADVRGTHMSRFLEVLNGFSAELSLRTVPELLAEIQRHLGAEEAFLDVRFPYFLSREAPVSGARSWMDYSCGFKAHRKGDQTDFILQVAVPVTTVCPCSKAISERGAHNQRGVVTVRLRFDSMVWIEDVVTIVEGCASSPVYALLKREDEKYVTEHAYDNPCFVEDLVREVVLALRELEGVTWIDVEVDNQESIHNHAAWARVRWPATESTPPSQSHKTPPSGETFGAWLRTQRKARRMSQYQVAGALSISPSLICRVEKDEKSLSARHLALLAHAWGLDPIKVTLRAGVIPEGLLARIQADAEGFLNWALTGPEPGPAARSR